MGRKWVKEIGGVWGITNPPGGVLLGRAEKMGEILASCLRVIEN